MWQKAKVVNSTVSTARNGKIIWIKGKPFMLGDTRVYETNLFTEVLDPLFICQNVIELLGTEDAFCEEIAKVSFYEWAREER